MGCKESDTTEYTHTTVSSTDMVTVLTEPSLLISLSLGEKKLLIFLLAFLSERVRKICSGFTDSTPKV